MNLDGKVIVVTGAGGLLGEHHMRAIEAAGGIVASTDIRPAPHWNLDPEGNLRSPWSRHEGYDVSAPWNVRELLDSVIESHGRIDGLINNAAINPKVEDGLKGTFEDMTLDQWNASLEVGLTGAFLCSQVFGKYMHEHGGGVILNVASVLSVIAPDQRLYDDGAKKPVTYSVEKHGLIGLTRYLATYWPNVRCNAISPAGVENGQPAEFIKRLSDKIPAGRMARPDEYKDAVVFALTCEYMNGHNLVIDGGYSVW